MPKGVFCFEFRVVNGHVFHVLERVFTLHAHPVDGDVLAVQKEIFAFNGAICQGYITTFPAEFRRNDLGIVDFYVLTLPQTFDPVDLAICDVPRLRIPYWRSGVLIKGGVDQIEFLGVPEGIAEREAAVGDIHISDLFQRRLAVGRPVKRAVDDGGILDVVEGTFFIVCFIFNFHSMFFLDLGEILGLKWVPFGFI